MTDRIEGKVAQVLNRQELVANVGSDHGVEKDMVFAVLNSRGVDVTDPDTGAPLGSVDIPKVLVKAVRVQPGLSVLRTYRTVRRNIGGRGNIAFDLFGSPPKWVEEPETLRTDDKPYTEELDESESYVKIGDPIVQVIGEEYLPPDLRSRRP